MCDCVEFSQIWSHMLNIVLNPQLIATHYIINRYSVFCCVLEFVVVWSIHKNFWRGTFETRCGLSDLLIVTVYTIVAKLWWEFAASMDLMNKMWK